MLAAPTAGSGYVFSVTDRDTTPPSVSLTASVSPSPSTAHLWVDTNGGTCTRSSTPAAYNDAKACGTFNQANQAASAGGGDLVLVKCGSYGGQIFSADTSHTGMTTIQSETPLCATVRGTTSTTLQFGSVRWVAIKNFTILDSTTSGVTITDTSSTGASTVSQHVSLIGNNINVGVKVKGAQAVLHAAQSWAFTGNAFGPSCCGDTFHSSPVPVSIGRPNPRLTPVDCTNEACNITITDNTFRYALRDASLWPSSGWGPAPDTTCTNAEGCHMDAIHIWGVQGAQINNNKLYGSECTGIFIENQSGAINSNIDIIGNAITAMAKQCNGGIGINFVGSGWKGTFNVKFNSLASQANLTFNTTANFTLNLVGNYGRLLMANASGNSAGCSGANTSVTKFFRYNVWTSGLACDATDRAAASNNWINSSPAPAIGQNMHLGASSGTADNFVPTNVPGGCPATDMDGNTRPKSPNCDAGAFER